MVGSQWAWVLVRLEKSFRMATVMQMDKKMFSIWSFGTLGNVIALLCPDFVLSCRVFVSGSSAVGQLQ